MEEENIKLRHQLARAYGQTENGERAAAWAKEDGIRNLWELYDQGFHVCNVFFGRTKSSDCLFCAALLNRDR